MRKAILLLVLVLASSSALAVVGLKRNWVAVADDDESTTYVFPSSIRKQGDKAQMWMLIDFRQPQTRGRVNTPFMSEKSEEEFDCDENRFRTLSFSFHPENMGNGAAIYNRDLADDWQDILADSDMEILQKIACGVIKLKPR